MDLRLLHGQWFVHYTNFPMWLKGDKTHPIITYSAIKRIQSMGDVVTYRKNGQERSIRGVDHQVGDGKFQWRGSGLLFFLTSDWQIDHLSEDGQWMIISFKKSFFTASGNDILSRHPTIDMSLADLMLKTFNAQHPGQSLKRIAQTAAL